jgi:hypothetical protein
VRARYGIVPLRETYAIGSEFLAGRVLRDEHGDTMDEARR